MQALQSHLSSPKYRPDIDGLRAIAVLSVVGYHAFPGWIKGGFIGVDVFFVISGFLISTIIFENLEKGTFSFVDFYARRIKRIFPALLFVLAACYTFGWFVLLGDEYKQLGKHIAGSAGFVANFVLWNEAGYFDNTAETKPLLHLWSLGIEEQFYIVWPLLLFLAWKKRFNLLYITISVAVVSFCLNIEGIGKDRTAAFYSPQTRFWELLCGSVLAWTALLKKEAFAPITGGHGGWLASIGYQPQSEARKRTLSNILSLSGLLLLACGFYRITRDSAFPGKLALIPVFGAALIIIAGPKAWLNHVILSRPLVVWFGLISFPLYLWHWPLLSFARIIESETPGKIFRITAILLAIVLAWVTYRFVEKPIRQGKYRDGRKTAVLLFLIMLFVGSIGFYTHAGNGFKFRRFHASNESSNAFEWPYKSQQPDCLRLISSDVIPYCLKSPAYDPSVALIGDSHANALFDFFAGYFGEKGRGVIMLGKNGCPPFLGVERDENSCQIVMDEITRYINSNRNIRDVYIAGRFAATESGNNFGREASKDFYRIRLIEKPEITDRREIFKTGFGEIMAALNKGNKNVTVVLDLPELDFHPKACLGARSKHRCSIDREIVFARQAPYREIIEELGRVYSFRVLDLTDAFCNNDECIAKFYGKILYRDSHHLGIYGNRFLLDIGFSPE